MTNPPLYDLHAHTTASDGKLSPRELLRLARNRCVQAIAITDHDTVEGLLEAEDEAGKLGVELVPGVEVSASYEGVPVHVLGLFVRHREPWLTRFFADAAARRRDRVYDIVRKLSREGVSIEPESVFARSIHGTVGRPHVAEVLVERGFVATIAEAFDRYLAEDRPAFVGYEKVTLADALGLIRRAGGVASLAHPGLLADESLVPGMVAEGLPALEVFHRDHTPAQVAAFEAMVAERGLLATGGSDFHQHDGAGGRSLGCRELTEEAFRRLKTAAG